MIDKPVETQDALLMAFVDRALSEVDILGRPLHEVYLISFGDRRYEGVHISSREDAVNFIAKMMNFRTPVPDDNPYTGFVEDFYKLVASSYADKFQQGRGKLFQKANMILLTDGIYEVNIASIQEARKTLPLGVDINLNFVSIGDDVNVNLQSLATNTKISPKKPNFRKITSQMLDYVSKVSIQYDAQAFVTEEKLSSNVLAEISAELQKINIDPRQPANKNFITQTLGQIQTTKSDVKNISGLNEILNLQKIGAIIENISINPTAKLRIVMAIMESYPHLAGRSWNAMTFEEKNSFEKLHQWSGP